MKTIRQQIEERYKPGVSFHAVNGLGEVLTDQVYTVKKHWELVEDNSGFHFFHHDGYIYSNGIFAPIVETNTPAQKVQPENKYPRTMLVFQDINPTKAKVEIFVCVRVLPCVYC